MRSIAGLFTRRSSQTQLLLAAIAAISIVALAGVLVTAMLTGINAHSVALPTAVLVILIAAAFSLGLFFVANRHIEQLQQARATQDHSAARLALDQRTRTVDHLLDFSQTIQGAGKADQVFATLSFFLRTELGLSGIVILSNDHDMVPTLSALAVWPESLTASGKTLTELDPSLCPGFRQNLPRVFKPDGSPIRSGLEQAFDLPEAQAGYSIPFNIGLRQQLLVYMLLPADQSWTEDRRQLAQTYINSAQSTLVSLRLLAEAEKQSMTDGLTQLYNRRSMEQLLQREVALSERHGLPLSIVMIDMDYFKQINDTHGHAAGDHLLRSFADCVRITLRRTDLAFRYGGDEFAIALPQTPLSQAQQVVAKLRQAFASVDFSDAVVNLEHQPTLSIGVAERSKVNNVLTLPSLLAAADQALYDAKNSNRNCVRIYQPPQAA